MSVRSPRLLFSFVLLLVVLVTTSRVHAQTLSLAQETSLQRLDASGQPLVKRPLFLHPEAINAKDCRDDQRIRLPIEMSGFHAYSVVQIWASSGADCASAANREPITGTCWNVVSGVPLQPSIDVDVPVRALLSPDGDESACGKVDLTTVDVQILMFSQPDDAAPVATKHVAITADTVGPEPPRAAVGPGNGRARVEIRAPSEASGVAAMVAFCEKSASESACSGTLLLPGAEAPDERLECGTAAGSGPMTFFTEPLENGTNHVVAIAARDTFGNLGPLSTLTCTTPSPDAETRVGSLDEPTGCSVGGARSTSAWGGALLGVLSVLALGLVLRRRRGSERA